MIEVALNVQRNAKMSFVTDLTVDKNAINLV